LRGVLTGVIGVGKRVRSGIDLGELTTLTKEAGPKVSAPKTYPLETRQKNHTDSFS
jgi:hypothetical protein